MDKIKRFCAFLLCIVVVSMCAGAPAAAVEAVQPETETAMEPQGTTEQENTTESEAVQSESEIVQLETETVQSESETVQTEPAAEPPQIPQTDTAPDYISTGAALTDWLETHKNTGGTVTLTDNIVLDSEYFFCPDAVNMPALFVDADCYTITVKEEVTFLSDAHLTFYGQGQEKGIFHVAKGGVLFLENIAVEGGKNALWQEEGAGLVVTNCHVSGTVRYADTPFVITANAECVLVEKGQTAGDALPAQISCAVNRQGEVIYNELLLVSWNLEESKTQQKKRLRFRAQGTFLTAASKKPLFCTVAYHDYPLTFLDVKAIQTPTQYQFRGGYAKPAEALPIRVATEYSFDGKNWNTYDEKTVSEILDAFFIGFEAGKWDTAKNPYVYIRLHWNDNGKKRFSNVLRYDAGNLSYAEDQGGSRGGGTSITNPPDEPQDNTEPKPSNESKPNTDTPNPVQSDTPTLTDTQPVELLSTTETAEIVQSVQSVQSSQTAENDGKTNDQSSQKQTATDTNKTTEEPLSEVTTSEKSFYDEPMRETVPAAALISDTGSHNPPQMQSDTNTSIRKTAAIGAGFVALFAVFAAAGYGLYVAKKRMLK